MSKLPLMECVVSIVTFFVHDKVTLAQLKNCITWVVALGALGFSGREFKFPCLFYGPFTLQ